MKNNMPDRPLPLRAAMRRIPITMGAVLMGAGIGFAGLYGIGGLRRSTAGDPACRGAVDLARRLAPLAHGEVAAVAMATPPLRLPDLALEDAAGKSKNVSDWLARTGLVNLWATSSRSRRKAMRSLESPQ